MLNENIKKAMYRLLGEVELKTRKKINDIAEILGISRQRYYQIKNNKNEQVARIVQIKKQFGFTWDEVGKALEEDYDVK